MGIAWTEVEELVAGSVRCGSECNAGEARRATAGRRGDLGGDVDFDGAVVELRAFEHGEAIAVFAGTREGDGFAAEVFRGLGVQTLLDEVLGVREREGLRRRDVGFSAASGGGGSEQSERAKSKVQADHAPNDTVGQCGRARFL